MLKMVNIQTGQFFNRNGVPAFTLYGLEEDGTVYRWNDRLDGWVSLTMEVREAWTQTANVEEMKAGVE